MGGWVMEGRWTDGRSDRRAGSNGPNQSDANWRTRTEQAEAAGGKTEGAAGKTLPRPERTAGRRQGETPKTTNTTTPQPTPHPTPHRDPGTEADGGWRVAKGLAGWRSHDGP